MSDGPRRKRARLWVRVYAAIFDVDERRLRAAERDRPDADDPHDTDERDDTTDTR